MKDLESLSMNSDWLTYLNIHLPIKKDPPRYTACGCHLTVKYTLFDCFNIIESRNRHEYI